MEEDIELSLSPPVRKANPKQGRRAGLSNPNDGNSNNFLDETTASMNNLRSRPVSGDLFLDDGMKNQQSAGPPLHGRRTGGWADENSRCAKAKHSYVSYFSIFILDCLWF